MNVFLKRIILVLVGFVIIGVGVGLLRVVDLGIDPFGAMNLGLSDITGLSFGTLLLLSSVPLFLLTLVKKRDLIGIGTIIGMFGVGYIIDFCYSLISSVLEISDFSFVIRILFLMIGLVILAVGASLYMTASLGMVPYDAFAIVVEELSNKRISFKWARIGQDFISAVVAFLLGATVGMATLMTVFCMGPLVSFFRKKFEILVKDI